MYVCMLHYIALHDQLVLFVLYLLFLQEVEEQPANLNYDEMFQDKANS